MFGELMHEHWEHSAVGAMTNPQSTSGAGKEWRHRVAGGRGVEAFCSSTASSTAGCAKRGTPALKVRFASTSRHEGAVRMIRSLASGRAHSAVTSRIPSRSSRFRDVRLPSTGSTARRHGITDSRLSRWTSGRWCAILLAMDLDSA